MYACAVLLLVDYNILYSHCGSCLTKLGWCGGNGAGSGECGAVPLLWDGPTELGRGVEVWRGGALPGATARSLLVELGVDALSRFTCGKKD